MAIDFHNGKWRVRVTRSGQAHTARFETRDEAESWERQFKAGEITSVPESASSNLFETTTLKDEIDDYKRRILPSKKKGERQLEVRLDQWASSAFGSKPLASIKLHDVQAWIDAQVSAGKAPSTVNNALGALSNIFAEAARKKGYRNVLNPTKGTRRPRNAPPREVYWKTKALLRYRLRAWDGLCGHPGYGYPGGHCGISLHKADLRGYQLIMEFQPTEQLLWTSICKPFALQRQSFAASTRT